jgi:hypothetical protein
MSSNRIHYFIRSILQNSKLNREKFVKNKKICNQKKRNYNPILKRNFTTNSSGLPPHNNNNNNNNNNKINMILVASSIVIYTTLEIFD